MLVDDREPCARLVMLWWCAEESRILSSARLDNRQQQTRLSENENEEK